MPPAAADATSERDAVPEGIDGPDAAQLDAGTNAIEPLDAGESPAPTRDAAPESDDDAGVATSIAAALLAWVVETIDAGRTPTSAELAQYFAPEFFAEVPEAAVLDTFQQLAQLRPFTLSEPTVTELTADARLETLAGPFAVHLEATAAEPHRIAILWFRPAADGGETPGSYEDATAPLEHLARDRQVLVAKVVDGACTPIYELNPTPRLAIGSAFKLWVLLALHQRLETDTSLSWATTLPIREELKSLPSGVLQNRPAGTRMTLDEYASKMISISDNTATDHLIDFIGRTSVEDSQTATQHSDPSANLPWFTTRELFVLKTSVTPSELQIFRAASATEKRALLDGLRTRAFDQTSLESWTAPRHLDLEWFASPHDMCRVLAMLGSRAQFSPSSQLLVLLGLNPGIPFDAAQWTYAGFKGGSEPGVLNASWLLRHANGNWFSVVITLNDPGQNIDANAAIAAATAVVSRLAADADR